MNSKTNLNNRKNINFMARSVNKVNNDKKIFSFRSNTQEIPQYSRSKNKSSSHKHKNIKNESKSMFNKQNYKSEEFPKKFMGISNTNISIKMNSDSNINLNNNDFNKINVNQYKNILHQKDKKIVELERQIKLYKDKLKNQITIININSSASLNNFNLSKTQSSKNVKERNLGQVRSYSNSNEKIKVSCPMSNNNNKVNNNKNIYRKRAKSNDYKKEKINSLIFVKNFNEIKKQHNNYFKNKSKSKTKIENSGNYKRAKSSKTEKRNINNNNTKSKVSSNSTNNELLSIEETQYLCDKMLEKMKKVLELVKISTTSED
jgi:hypothetical protein